MKYQIKSHEEDSRALLENEMQVLLGNNPRKPLDPYVQLVKDYEDLELCFRGNSEKDPRISIYYNNNIILNVHISGRIEVSFNHARYCKNWKDYYYMLKDDFDFNCPELETQDKEINIGMLSRPLRHGGRNPLTYNEIKNLYNNILLPINTKYFEATKEAEKGGMVQDYFKHGEFVKPNQKTEKIEQQKLYRIFKSLQSGYFFYDLEFAQRRGSRAALESAKVNKINNEPDMQAIRFDENCVPDRIVFVEVKSTKAAMDGGSGIFEHIRKMLQYPEDKLVDRRKEACDILNQYAQLNLRDLSDSTVFQYKNFENLELEILLIFTCEAKKIWETEDSYSTIRKEIPKVEFENKDVLLYRCDQKTMKNDENNTVVNGLC